MLHPEFKAVGIGRVANPGAYYRYYWTTDFGGVVDTILTPSVPPVSTVSAASYAAEIAPDSLASTFGSGLASGVYRAGGVPLLRSLGGTEVTLNGQAVELLYVSPTQINFIVPSNIGTLVATLEVKTNGVLVGKGTVTVSNVAPSLFTATANGKGVPAGYSTFDGKTLTLIFNPDGTSRPLAPGTTQRPNHLVLFGTGFRKRSNLSNVQVRIGGILCEVNYAGAQSQYIGLDQLNVVVPPSASGSGEVDLLFIADNKPANIVRVNIGN
jgi:uncharacterized protein (TIGR03437 family)